MRKQVIGQRNNEMSFQFCSIGIFKSLFTQSNPRIYKHEPVDFQKTTKIEPHENKVFHSTVCVLWDLYFSWISAESGGLIHEYTNIFDNNELLHVFRITPMH